MDTGSSDCELREGLLKCLPPLPVVARGVSWTEKFLESEASTGSHVGASACHACHGAFPRFNF